MCLATWAGGFYYRPCCKFLTTFYIVRLFLPYPLPSLLYRFRPALYFGSYLRLLQPYPIFCHSHFSQYVSCCSEDPDLQYSRQRPHKCKDPQAVGIFEEHQGQGGFLKVKKRSRRRGQKCIWSPWRMKIVGLVNIKLFLKKGIKNVKQWHVSQL